MRFIVRIIITALAVVISSYILPGVSVDGGLSALIVAAVLALLNAFVKPLLIILTIPITIFTLGLFLLVINALMILAAAELVNGFHVSGFWAALLFSIVLTIVVSLLNALVKSEE
ncbi:MAG TPA: phage holin family protein [Bacteroidia bacterium]|nr:phage holin family protein [Bacteroidia bacterium]